MNTAIRTALRGEIKHYLKRNGPSQFEKLVFNVLLNTRVAQNGGMIMDEVKRMIQFDHLHVNHQGLVADGSMPKLTAVIVKGESDE